MSQTCHMRHTITADEQIIKKLFCSCNNMLNATFQYHPIKMGCCKTNKNSLSVTTIDPIWHSHPVHPGKKQLSICSLKSKENIIFPHNFISKNTNKPSNLLSLFSIEQIFLPRKIRYFILFAINTHIDCLNNSKCSVRYIFKAT